MSANSRRSLVGQWRENFPSSLAAMRGAHLLPCVESLAPGAIFHSRLSACLPRFSTETPLPRSTQLADHLFTRTIDEVATKRKNNVSADVVFYYCFVFL